MTGNIVNRECVFSLTDAHSLRTLTSVIVSDIERALHKQYEEDRKQIRKYASEMDRYRSAWMRYRDLQRATEMLEDRMVRIIAAVGEQGFATLSGKQNKSGKSKDEVAVVSGEIPLWKAIAAIVEVKPGIQVVELHHILEAFGHKTSRSAIESALETHKGDFEIRRDGRRKYVSLKKGA